MMKLRSNVGVLLLYLLAAVLVVYSLSLVFLSNFNMGNLMVWVLTAAVHLACLLVVRHKMKNKERSLQAV